MSRKMAHLFQWILSNPLWECFHGDQPDASFNRDKWTKDKQTCVWCISVFTGQHRENIEAHSVKGTEVGEDAMRERKDAYAA